MKGFKYQITSKYLLKKLKENRDIEFAPVSFNSSTKTVINFEKYIIDEFSQEIFYRIDNWINEGYGQVIESADAEYVNISVFSPFSGSTYIISLRRLTNSIKGLINFFFY